MLSFLLLLTPCFSFIYCIDVQRVSINLLDLWNMPCRGIIVPHEVVVRNLG